MLSFVAFLIQLLILNASKKVHSRKSTGNLFIIAGAQKSGTTVLSAFLSDHPNIYFSKKKEIHFFDKISNYKKGIRHYAKNWDNFNSSHLLFGEATPYYIASREACRRISQHYSQVKMIVLLREPVLRAYSEYQMKKRRVNAQNEFFSLVAHHADEFVRCISSSQQQLHNNTSCFPSVIQEHPYLTKLKTAMSKSAEKLASWTEVLDRCFPLSSTCPAMTNHHRVPTLFIFSSDATCHESSSVNQTYLQALMGDIPTRLFASKACYSYYRSNYESILPVEKALLDEANSFSGCANYAHLIGKHANSVATPSVLRHINESISRCVNPKAGISSQYIYRSLYAVQLYHCFKYIPSSRFLILPSEQLRQQPLDVLRIVHEFLQLSFNLTWAEDAVHRLDRTIDNRYADFARRTSWQLNSQYESLAPNLARKLHAFFHPHNQLLFQLIGKNFTNDW